MEGSTADTPDGPPTPVRAGGFHDLLTTSYQPHRLRIECVFANRRDPRRAVNAARLSLMWFQPKTTPGPRVGVLPAFGAFTGAATVSPAPGDRVFALADEQVIDVTQSAGG